MELIGDDELESKPGEAEEDSETEDVFLAEVIERASGMSLFQFEKKYIFDVLGMTETTEGCSYNTAPYMIHKNTELVRLAENFRADGAFTTTHKDLVDLWDVFVMILYLQKNPGHRWRRSIRMVWESE